MAAGICSSAVPAISGVSLLETISTAVILSPSMVTETVMGPPKPLAVPVSGPPAAPDSCTYLLAAFTQATTAEELMVAPVTASMLLLTARSPLEFMRPTRKKRSSCTPRPRP